MNNDNKKLSRNRKRRIDQKIKMDEKMKSILNNIKTEKKKKNKKFDKSKHLEIELIKKSANSPNKLLSELKELNKILVIDKIFNEIKQEILRDYAGEFEMVENYQLQIMFGKLTLDLELLLTFESYINAIGQDYQFEDAVFNGYICRIKNALFNLVNRSQYGNGCDFKHEDFKYRGNKCFIPTKGYCFVKCIHFITGENYK